MNGSTGVTWRQVRVGGVISLALVLLAVSIFLVGETGAVFGERYQLTALMPSANGLIEGASVRVAGQDVGKVARIEFVAPEDRRSPDQVLKVTLAIDRRVRDQIRSDSEARLRTQGLLGDKMVDISPGSPDARVLEEGDTLITAVAIDYEQMIGSAAELVEDVGSMVRNLRIIADSLLAGEGAAGKLLKDSALYVELLNTSRSLNRFLGTVSEGEGALARLARDEGLYEDLRSVMAGLDTLTAMMLHGEGTLSLLLTDESLYARLESTSARADSMLLALEQGQGALGQMLTDQEIYEELLKLVGEIQAVVQELREDPRKYIPPIQVF